MSITITRALAEIKLLEKRINDSISKSKLITTKTRNQNLDVEAFKNTSLSSYQSCRDLITRHHLLKRKIIESNSKTMVVIGKNTYSVSEAIERKNSIIFERNLLILMKNQNSEVQTRVQEHEVETQGRLDRFLEINFGKDVKVKSEDYQSISKTFLENNKMEVVDALDIKTKIQNLEEEIDDFLKEVDLALSESNAKTIIQI